MCLQAALQRHISIIEEDLKWIIACRGW
ncbi:hypothetical protein LCGC14_2142760, partial [marine sediment metagenome]